MIDEIYIENHLSVGHENGKSMKTLMEETGLSNRRVRKELEYSAKRGNFIGNLQDGKGYFLFDLPKESELAERYLKQEWHRAIKILNRISPLEGYTVALGDGNKYKVERKRRCLTQKQVAKETGIETSRYSQIERGKTDPSLKERIELEKLFKV